MKIGKLNISKKILIVIGVVVLVIIGGTILLTKGGSKGKGILYNPDKNIKIVKSEASQIEFEDFSNGDITLKKPKGWKVITAGSKDQYAIRVYDTETNEIYKAYNRFTDDYDGERYKSITDDMYTEKTSVYIEK